MGLGINTLRDIEEIPQAINKVIDYKDSLEDLARELLSLGVNKIFYIGCGSSYYASMLANWPTIRVVGKDIVSWALPSSEALIYYSHLFDAKTAVIGISRSGETSETLAVLEKAKNSGSYTILLSITKKSRGREIVDKYMYLDIGEERSVVMTKSFVSLSLAGLMLLGWIL